MKYEDRTTVENYYLYLYENVTSKNLEEFILAFREKNCYKPSNIYVFNTDAIINLIDKYPLKGKEYIKYADSLIGMMEFELNNVTEYPLKDLYYKEQLNNI